ncbi:MAG: efflux RND transporter periplasmic adaptor subunit [Planctomycetes bacterium]|nr:efflux RND transporter periplasmic adaptor subunit [Planctomycetota bacterium]
MVNRTVFFIPGKSALLLAAGLSGCLLFSPGCKPAASVAEQPSVPKVTVTPVISQEITDTDEYTGRTEASDSVTIRSRVFGFLKSIDFKDGDFVTEGQTLFTIEPEEYEAIHQQSMARIALNTARNDLAKATLARKEKVVKGGHITQEEYEEAIAAVKESEATITAAKADANKTAVDLKHTVVKAPFNGRIDRAFVSVGSLLTGGQASGTELTKLVKEQPMYAYFDVDERSLLGYMKLRPESESAPGSLRKLGIPCFLQLANEKDFTHEGQLDFASAEVNYGTGTARLRGVFPNKKRELASGLFVRVRIPVSKPYQALLIPERALATDQDIKFVYVVGSDGAATRHNVVLGAQRGDLRIVKSGLKAGDRVIVKGLQRVKPGQKVEAEAAPPPAVGASAPHAGGTSQRRKAEGGLRNSEGPVARSDCAVRFTINAQSPTQADSPDGKILHRSSHLRRGHFRDHHDGRGDRRQWPARRSVS